MNYDFDIDKEIIFHQGKILLSFMSPLLRVEFEVPSRTGAVSQIMYVPYASVENTLCVVTLHVLITRCVLLQSLFMEAIKLVETFMFCTN